MRVGGEAHPHNMKGYVSLSIKSSNKPTRKSTKALARIVGQSSFFVGFSFLTRERIRLTATTSFLMIKLYCNNM